MWNGTKRKREIVEFLQLIDGGQNGIPSRLLVLRAGVGNGLIANTVDLSSEHHSHVPGVVCAKPAKKKEEGAENAHAFRMYSSQPG
jgi:hypothetical protein